MEPGEYERKEIGSPDSGGVVKKGILYSSLNTSTTQGSEPLSLQVAQKGERQPPILRLGHSPYLEKSCLTESLDLPPLSLVLNLKPPLPLPKPLGFLKEPGEPGGTTGDSDWELEGAEEDWPDDPEP